MMDKDMTLEEINENRINHHLSLRKKQYNKILNNKRKIFTKISSLIANSSCSPNSLEILFNNNLFKIFSKEEILEIIEKLKIQKLSLNNNLTEIYQCLFSLDYQMNQNLENSIHFMEENKIYIFLINIIEKIFNTPNEININNISNNLEPQLLSKTLQIIFKYSTCKDNNLHMINYIIRDNRINIFNQIILSFSNKLNNIQQKIIVNDTKKTNILLYIIALLYNLSIESIDLFSLIQNIKIDEKIISLINDEKNNIHIDDNNIIYFIEFFSLYLFDDKNVENKEENYIIDICEFLHKKGITSLNQKALDFSLRFLCNVTSSFESAKLYQKIMYSGIFENIFQFIKKSKNISQIIISLKIVINILDEKKIDINYFIKSDLLKGLINLILNYDKNKHYMTPSFLHYIINIFLYLTKSSLFYSLVNNNLNFIIILVNLIGIVSNQVTHEILTFIKNVINESYKISQLIIFNNEELIIKLIDLIKENCHNDLKTMSAVILSKIMKYIYKNKNELNEENKSDFNFREYEIQIKDIIEIKILNEKDINKNLEKMFKIILGIINENK